MPKHHDFLVGTFSTPVLFTIRFTPAYKKIEIIKEHQAVGSHSWLHLSQDRQHLFATAWTEPPSLAAYRIRDHCTIDLINTAATKSRSGYVCASETHAYSAGGAIGEVFELDSSTGGFLSAGLRSASEGAKPVQSVDFVDGKSQRDNGSTLDFGGLRHGAHSADLSPDGKLLYVADIGRNCIWTLAVSEKGITDGQHVRLAAKTVSPRANDGPRHVHPHPGGRYVYCLQEHTSVVDVFEVLEEDAPDQPMITLRHVQAVPTIPLDQNCTDFWADEVRTSLSGGAQPGWLYASTRGLTPSQKGFVSVYKLTPEGLISGAPLVQSGDDREAPLDPPSAAAVHCFYQTATSGGWANAIQPGPTIDGIEYLAMTDSEVGYVFVLSWDGTTIRETCRLNLNDGHGSGKKSHGAATAVWLC